MPGQRRDVLIALQCEFDAEVREADLAGLDGEQRRVAAEVPTVDPLAGQRLPDRLDEVALARLVGADDRRHGGVEVDANERKTTHRRPSPTRAASPGDPPCARSQS
jgi:hypothetical protein